MKAVIVTWLDTHSFSRWRSKTILKYLEPVRITSVGLLAYENDHKVVLVMSAEGTKDGNLACGQAIPRSTIVEVRELGEVDIPTQRVE